MGRFLPPVLPSQEHPCCMWVRVWMCVCACVTCKCNKAVYDMMSNFNWGIPSSPHPSLTRVNTHTHQLFGQYVCTVSDISFVLGRYLSHLTHRQGRESVALKTTEFKDTLIDDFKRFRPQIIVPITITRTNIRFEKNTHAQCLSLYVECVRGASSRVLLLVPLATACWIGASTSKECRNNLWPL